MKETIRVPGSPVSAALLLCTTVPTTGGIHRWILIGIIALYSIGVFALIIRAATCGRPIPSNATRSDRWRARIRVALAVTGVYLASAIPLSLIATLWEGRSILPLANPLHGSFSLLYGDGLVLPITIGICAVAWRRLPPHGWFRDWPWLALSIIGGLGAAAAFHHHVVGAYNAFRYNSLSNLWHDFGTFPLLMAATIYLAAPVIFGRSTGKLRWLVVAGITLMILLLAHEAAFPLTAAAYHPMANMADWDRVIHCMLHLPRGG